MKIEDYKPVVAANKPVAIEKKRDVYVAQVDDKSLMAMSIKDIKSAIEQAVMYKVTSDWTLMIILKDNYVKPDLKFMGIIKESGKPERYVISDVIQDGPSVSAWHPAMTFKVWEDISGVKLIPFSEARIKALIDIHDHVIRIHEKVRDTIFSDSGTSFLDDYSKDPDVIHEVI